MPTDLVSSYYENFPGHDITAEEFVFLKAMERYQRLHRRRYPTWREVLFVLKSLGYRKVCRADAIELECLYPLEKSQARSDVADPSDVTCDNVDCDVPSEH